MEHETQITSSGYSLIKMFYNMLCEYFTLSWDLKENIGDCFINREANVTLEVEELYWQFNSLPESS